MAAITVTSVAAAPTSLPGQMPTIVGVTSSGAAAVFVVQSSVWKILPMVTT